MTFQVNVTATAEKDLQDIYDYIAIDLKSPEIAESFLAELENRILSLSEMPERHRVYEKEPWKQRGLRLMPVKNHVVFYLVQNDEHTVHVIRVLYGKRDLEAQLP